MLRRNLPSCPRLRRNLPSCPWLRQNPDIMDSRPTPQPEPPSLKTTPPVSNIPATKSMPPEAEAAAPVTAEPAAVTADATAPVVNATVDSTPPPPFDCKVTSSRGADEDCHSRKVGAGQRALAHQ